jgi:hypothetical protein
MKCEANGKPNYTVKVSLSETAPSVFLHEPFVYSTDSLEDGIRQFRILAAFAEHLVERKGQKWTPESPLVGQGPILEHQAESELDLR